MPANRRDVDLVDGGHQSLGVQLLQRLWFLVDGTVGAVTLNTRKSEHRAVIGFVRRAASCFADTTGLAAVEFALIAPVFCLILVGAIDLGRALYTKFGIDSAVSAAANYAVNNASSVNSGSGSSLAVNLASIVASGHAANWANATVVVNNGPSATLTAGVITSSGTAANADSCYCPTRGASGVTWGAPVACGATCATGGIAGKFISIVASRTFVAIFSSYGIVKSGAIGGSAVVETQ